jgi:hypothetical protein
MSMSDWELVDDGSWNGLRKWMRASDEDHGTVQVAYDQINLQQTLADNKRAQNHETLDRRSDLWHAATIPPIVELEWLTKYGVRLSDPNHGPAIKRLLNSSEYAHLKRAPIVL